MGYIRRNWPYRPLELRWDMIPWDRNVDQNPSVVKEDLTVMKKNKTSAYRMKCPVSNRSK